MPEKTNIEKLKEARDEIADVYQKEAIDEIFDNGNLSTMNNAILALGIVIKKLEDRENQ